MKLDQKRISYEISSDFDVLIENGLLSMPVLLANDKFMEFSEAVKYVNEL